MCSLLISILFLFWNKCRENFWNQRMNLFPPKKGGLNDLPPAEKQLLKIRNKNSRLIYCMLHCMCSESPIWLSILMNSFLNEQFNYCPLMWMLHSRRNNNTIRNIHERCLALIYDDKNSPYEGLLTKDDSVSIKSLEMKHKCEKWKHQNVWNMFKINFKSTRKTSLTYL